MKRKFCVIQFGSRYGYQIPLFFAKKGILNCFYTDLHGSHIIFDLFKFIPNLLIPNSLKRLLLRKLPKGLEKKFVDDNLLNIFIRDPIKINNDLMKKIINSNFANANAIYTNVITGDIEILKIAKKKGMFIIHEVFLNPNFSKIAYKEALKYPELVQFKKEKLNQSNIDLDLIKYNLADKILVPSKYIFKELIKKGVLKNKIQIVEHSIKNEKWLNVKTNPIKGRILFVGKISLMKGSHYFAKICREFIKNKFNYEFIAVGKEYLDLKNPLMRGPKYLGHLGFDELEKIYSTSDILVIPYLSDAFPEVHVEAMSFGLPVIITDTCGSIVRDGIDGFVVPFKDTKQIKSKIIEIVENRKLREKMSKASKERINNYKPENYFDRLATALDI